MSHFDLELILEQCITDASSSIEFTPSEPGEYEFVCTVAVHKEAGMVGTLIVKVP